MQRQQLPQTPHPQERQWSEDCYAFKEKLLPSLPPLPPPPSPLPPLLPLSPPLPPQQPRCLQARSTARPVPESVATLFCTREEKRRDGITWPARSGRDVEEILSAMEHAFEFWNNVKRAVVGTGGRVCTIDWGSEHGRERRRCPKRARVKEKGITGHQRALRPAPGT